MVGLALAGSSTPTWAHARFLLGPSAFEISSNLLNSPAHLPRHVIRDFTFPNFHSDRPARLTLCPFSTLHLDPFDGTSLQYSTTPTVKYPRPAVFSDFPRHLYIAHLLICGFSFVHSLAPILTPPFYSSVFLRLVCLQSFQVPCDITPHTTSSSPVHLSTQLPPREKFTRPPPGYVDRVSYPA